MTVTRPRRGILLLAVTTLAGCSTVAGWTGEIVSVHDGDTLTAVQNGQHYTLRLNAIDAPELDQAFGVASQQSLAALCLQQTARIDELGHDKYDRVLARVSCRGLDVNSEQIRLGMAWHYTRYSQDRELAGLEGVARTQKRGLWSLPQPEAPWHHRHAASAASGQPAPSPARMSHHSDAGCGTRHYCREMTDCAEALYYFRECKLSGLDGNHDGTPCESLCRSSHPVAPL